MREYIVRPGDSPASIASRPEMAGCPRCARDLVAVNAHKQAVTHPNGFRSFKELRVGEKLNLPNKWFNGELDRMPPAYFASLPHHDGVTPGVHGVSGALGDPASDAVTALAQLDNRTFSIAVDPAIALIEQSVMMADGNPNPGVAAYAAATHVAASSAKGHNQELIRALGAGDQAGATQARLAVQNDLLTAIDTAGLAIKYGGAPALPSPSADTGGVVVDIGQATILPGIQAIAQAAATAIAADPNFCANVAQVGSTVNTAVHAFKTAWNSANPGNPVPINTGTYDQATAAVLTQILGSAPPACSTRAATPPPATSIPLPGITPPQLQAQAPAKSGLSTGAVVGMSLVGVGAVGGALYLVTRGLPQSRRKVRRVSASSDHCGYRVNYGNGQVSSMFNTIKQARAQLSGDWADQRAHAFIEFRDCDTRDWFPVRGRK